MQWKKVRKNHTRKWVCHISFLFVYFGHWKKEIFLSKKKNLLILVKLVSGVDDELAKIVHNDRFQMCKFPFGPHPILTQVFNPRLSCLLILVKLGSGVDDELAKIVHNDHFQMCKFPSKGPHPILTQVFNPKCCCWLFSYRDTHHKVHF